MRTVRGALAALLLALLSACTGAGATAERPADPSIRNGVQFLDTSGAPLHAHGGGVLKVGEFYYWFGENRDATDTFQSVSAYRSTDLRHWEFRHHVLTRNSAPELAAARIERPKVVYNASNGTFVMWMHKETNTSYDEARAAVAVSSTVDGDYAYRGSFRPLNYESRDITAFADADGTGYVVSAANGNRDLFVYRLTADYLGIDALVANPWPNGHREAPALFQRDGVYFMLTSGASGWNPNQQQYATAPSPAGPWTEMANVGNATGFASQTAFVLPVQGASATSYLYLGDRWGGSFGRRVNDSRYVWLPLTFPTPTSMDMAWSPQIDVDAAAGTVAGVEIGYDTLVPLHSGKCAEVTDPSRSGERFMQNDCTGTANQQYWLEPVDEKFHRIVVRNSSMCVQDNPTTVTQEICDPATAGQQWVLTERAGYLTIASRSSGRCLDVNGASADVFASVITFACSEQPNQQWARERAN